VSPSLFISASISPSASVSLSKSPSPSPIEELVIPETRRPILDRNLHILARNLAGLVSPPSRNYETIPTWNTLGRPQKPKTGNIGFNFQTNDFELWDGITWNILPTKIIK